MVRRFLPAAMLLAVNVGACQPRDPQAGEMASAAVHELDRYLDERFSLLRPDRVPNAEEIALGCDSATSDAIRELEKGGALVEPTYEETIVRNAECRWAANEPRIATCRFENASIPLEATLGDEARRANYVENLQEKDWTEAAARFALVAWVNPQRRSEARWIATDTCQPFVFKGDSWEIDPRAIVPNRQPTN